MKKFSFIKEKLKRRTSKKDLVRIEELKELLESNNGEIDPEVILSMYIPRRKRKKLAATLLKISKMQLVLLSLVLVVAGLFIAAFMQEKMGNFTINLNRLELYRRGVSIADNGDFYKASSRLSASTVFDATNISVADLPSNLSKLEGNNNGKNYMAYTYFIRNAGKETVDYAAQIKLEECSKGAENAVRIAVWRNDERLIYATPSKNGKPEEGCVNFLNENIVCNYDVYGFEVGHVDKYTVVVWMEGDDPECLDNIIGGSVEFAMYMDSIMNEKESLFTWFVEDVVDFLTGDKPIDAYGNIAPNFYDDEITYDNRTNKEITKKED